MTVCTEYDYCPNCAKTHAWKFYADTRLHYQIYMILESYNAKITDIDEAKAEFKNIGINADSIPTDIKPHVADMIKAIVCCSESKNNKAVKKTDSKSEE